MGNNLAKIRGKHNLNQTQLADKIGVSKQGLCFNEVGKCSVTTANKVAVALKENVFAILGTDVFVLKPKTEADKEAFMAAVKEVLGEE